MLQRLEVDLRDGTRALIRPIRPDDKRRLQQGLQLLSPESRYLRFHSPVAELTDAQLRYLTEIDYRDHMAWVALDPERPDEPGMAVARYVRMPSEPHVAEAAITVADRCQGRGLGSLLLGILARSAVDNGIRTLRSYVLAENKAMLRIFERLGARLEFAEDGLWRVDLDLPDELEEVPPELARNVLRAAAKQELPPMPVIDPPWWMNLTDRDRLLKRRGPDRQAPQRREHPTADRPGGQEEQRED